MAGKKNDAVYDTRGLPIGFDPHNFYEYQSAKVSSGAESFVENLIWRLIPYSYIRSFAIAIDPYYKFKVSPVSIIAANRTRTKVSSSIFSQITRRPYNRDRLFANSHLPNGCPRDDLGWEDKSVYTTPDYFKTGGNKRMTMSDTTFRTRPFGCEYGESEFFKFIESNPDRHTAFLEDSTQLWYLSSCAIRADWYRWVKDYRTTISPGSYITQDAVDKLRLQVKAKADAFMVAKTPELVRRAMPESRSFNLGRSIIELKDLPRSIESMKSTVLDFSRLLKSMPKDVEKYLHASQHIPSEYLSFVFGWRQLVSDIFDTLVKPQKIAKRINNLVIRNGKNTTFRSKSKKIDRFVPGASSWTYISSGRDLTAVSTTEVMMTSELRVMLNAKFDFPPVDQVNFRHDLFLKKLGASPGPSDFYDLVPWTWLFDWFTGFGNYLHIMEEIASDRSLVNFGFSTVSTEGSLTTNFKYKNSFTTNMRIYPSANHEDKQIVENTHVSVLDFEYYNRRDVATVSNVKAISDMGTLTPYQNTILGALLAQRVDFRR